MTVQRINNCLCFLNCMHADTQMSNCLRKVILKLDWYLYNCLRNIYIFAFLCFHSIANFLLLLLFIFMQTNNFIRPNKNQRYVVFHCGCDNVINYSALSLIFYMDIISKDQQECDSKFWLLIISSHNYSSQNYLLLTLSPTV